MNADNVGNSLIKHTAKQLGMIRAIQELYPEIDFGGIGNVGLDQYSANIKLSSIVDKATKSNDVSDVIESIKSGFDEIVESKVIKSTGRELPKESVFNALKKIPEPSRAKNAEQVTVEETKKLLFDAFGLKDDAEKYKTIDLEGAIGNVNSKLVQAREQLKLRSFNVYAPEKGIEAAYQNTYLKNQIKELKNSIESLLLESENLKLDNLLSQQNLMQSIGTDGLNQMTIRQQYVGGQLVRLGLIDETEMERLLKEGTKLQFSELQSNILGKLKAAKSFSTDVTGKAIADFFTSYIQKGIDGSDPENSPVRLMDQLLYEIEDMKNKTRVPSVNKELRKTALFGQLIEAALGSKQELNVNMGSETIFSLQDLRNYVSIKHNKEMTERYADDTKKITDIIQGMIEKSAMTSDEKLAAAKNLMDEQLLDKLFPVDLASATNIETKSLKSIPKLIAPEQVQEVLNGLPGGSDLDDIISFLEEFLAINKNPEEAEKVIEERLKIANDALGDSKLDNESIFTKVQDRRNKINSIKNRYNALISQQTDEYSRLQDLFKTGREISPGVFLPDLESAPIDSAPIKASDLVEDVVNNLIKNFNIAETDPASQQSINQSLSSSSVGNPGSYTRIQDFLKSAKMKEVYEGLLKNKTKIIGAAAIGTGLAIFGSIRNKERTQESLSGPPLLPGGNPYERIPNTPMNPPEAPIVQGNQGMSYNVSVNGDQDKIQEFMTRARTSNKQSNTRYYA